MNEREQLDYLTNALKRSTESNLDDHKKSKEQLITELQALRKQSRSGVREIPPSVATERDDVERLQQMFQLIIDTIPVSIWWKDRDSRFLGCNRRIAQAAGYEDPQQLIGKTDYDCPWKKEESDWFVEWDKKVMETDRAHYHIIEPKLTADGKQVWLDTTKVPLHDNDGNVVGTLGTYEDITERKQAEIDLTRAHEELARTHEELQAAHALLEQRVKERTMELEARNLQLKCLSTELIEARDQAMEASRYKSMFLANMSHEIRTPLNSVIAVTELLLNSHLDGEQQELADIIHNSSRSLLDIVQDILDFSKIEAGKVDLCLEDFDVRTTVHAVMELLGAKAAEKSLSLTGRIVGKLPTVLKGDAARIKQVLLNLVSNAIKFTSKGGIDILLESEVSDEHGCVLTFTVSDTGIGLPEASAEALFEPFTQADGSITRRFGGTGLGLSICRELVHLMGGDIGVSSQQGRGSSFWFTLQFDRQPDWQFATVHDVETAGRSPSIKSTKKIPRRSKHKALILVADDSPLNRKVALLVLKHLGLDAHAVSNGQEAIDALAERPFDLVLMDCQMPLLDGFETTRRIRQTEQNTPRHTPIIALTAQAIDGDREKCLQAGMDDYITKPVTSDRLSSLLSQWLPKKSLKR